MLISDYATLLDVYECQSLQLVHGLHEHRFGRRSVYDFVYQIPLKSTSRCPQSRNILRKGFLFFIEFAQLGIAVKGMRQGAPTIRLSWVVVAGVHLKFIVQYGKS